MVASTLFACVRSDILLYPPLCRSLSFPPALWLSPSAPQIETVLHGAGESLASESLNIQKFPAQRFPSENESLSELPKSYRFCAAASRGIAHYYSKDLHRRSFDFNQLQHFQSHFQIYFRQIPNFFRREQFIIIMVMGRLALFKRKGEMKVKSQFTLFRFIFSNSFK